MRKFQGKFLSVVVMVACIVATFGSYTHPTQAASSADGLLHMLARVPDSIDTQSYIMYNDLSAIVAAYPSAKVPTTEEQFLNTLKPDSSSSDADANGITIWWLSMRNMRVPFTQYLFAMIKDGKSVVGFSFFDIDRSLSYGRPPSDVLQLEGRFDQDAIRKALTAQGFAKQDQPDAELWCSSDGCDGTRIDPNNIKPANPFGGQLGRKQPLITGDGYLISSPQFDLISQHIKTIKTQSGSLAQLPKYQAAAGTIASDGVLLQAMILDGQYLQAINGGSDPLRPFFLGDAKPDVRKALAQRILETYEQLPQYDLIIIGDMVTDTQQVGRIGLVYDNAQDAETAAKIITTRIDQPLEMFAKASIREVFVKAQRVTDITTQIVKHDATGKSVLLINFAAPKLSADEILQFKHITGKETAAAPGIIAQRLFSMAIRSDLSWLVTTPRSALEKVAQSSQ